MEKTDVTWKVFGIYMLVIFFMLVAGGAFAQIQVTQFNAGWNSANEVPWVMDLEDCNTYSYTDIADAKELPAPPDPEVTRMEFDMKDQMIRQTIMTTQEDVKEIKVMIEKIEDKIYE